MPTNILRLTPEMLANAQRIAEQVAQKYGCTPQDLLAHCKQVRLREMYQEYYARLLFEANLSTVWAARVAKRDHTSIVHSVKAMAHKRYGLPMKIRIAEIRNYWLVEQQIKRIKA